MHVGAEKPAVLVVVGHYLPGFKAGGILRSVCNLVDHLHDRFSFFVLTRDRDFGDAAPYADVETGRWTTVGPAQVYYLPPDACGAAGIVRVVNSRPFALVYLNSFFEPMCVHVLTGMLLGRVPRVPTVLAPRGEFAWASLRIKYAKKLVYMVLARATGLFRGVVWHAANDDEAAEIGRVLHAKAGTIRVAPDLPSVLPDEVPARVAVADAADDAPRGLRVVFLSRVSPEKNLDLAIQALCRVRSEVCFDIIGPLENEEYWKSCTRLLASLPAHVRARHLGTIRPEQVVGTLAGYDLMLFPSGGESFGHVIAESMLAGTPVLTSTATPWRDLESQGLGWTLPLSDLDAFARVIDEVAVMPLAARAARRAHASGVARRLLAGTESREAHVRLFEAALG